MKMAEKRLLALDFDHTLIDENSDVYVIQLAPNKELPQEIKDRYSDNGWTEYMGEIFKFLHNHGISEDNFKTCISEIQLTLGMKELFNFVKDDRENYEIIVISDSNSVFIDMVLERFDLKKVVNHVFTNPAVFDTDGCLTIKNYHTQDWCKLSTVNLCKGHILQDYIQGRAASGVVFSSVFYIGDGSNDLCPGFKLTSKDFLCPRVGFPLWKKINALMEDEAKKPPQAQIYPWESGTDIVGLIKNITS